MIAVLTFMACLHAGAAGLVLPRHGATEAHVVYASDRTNFAGLFASMTSLTQHLDPAVSCTIHIFTPRQEQRRLRQLINACFLPNHRGARPEVVLHPTPAPSVSVAKFIASGNGVRNDLLRPETFVRLYLHDYLPDLHRVLWLDTDTIVKEDVGQLFRVEMRHALAGVTYGVGFNLSTYLTSRSSDLEVDAVDGPGPADPSAEVFNTGVLLLNLDHWRSGSFTQLAERWMQLMAGRDTEADQLLTNLAMGGHFDQLDARWNLVNLGLSEQVRKQMGWDHVSDDSLERAWVLHWTGSSKPWLQTKGQPPNHYISWFAPYDRQGTCAALAHEG